MKVELEVTVQDNAELHEVIDFVEHQTPHGRVLAISYPIGKVGRKELGLSPLTGSN